MDGDFTPLMAEDPQIWAYTRTTPDRKLLVIANCGRDPRAVDIGREWIAADLLLGNLPDTPATLTSTSLDLAALGRAHLLRRPTRTDAMIGNRTT